jgi:hypothetical protein
MGPFWLIPGDRPIGKANGAVPCVSFDEDVDTEAAEDLKSAFDLMGAIPHRPFIHPPTSRVSPPGDGFCSSCCTVGRLAIPVRAATLELTLLAGSESSADGVVEELELNDLVELKAVYSVTVASGWVEGTRRATEGGRAKYALLPLRKLDDLNVVEVGRLAIWMSMPEIETRES